MALRLGVPLRWPGPVNSTRMNLVITLIFAALLLVPWAVAQEGDAQPDTESARIDRILGQMGNFPFI